MINVANWNRSLVSALEQGIPNFCPQARVNIQNIFKKTQSSTEVMCWLSKVYSHKGDV